MSVCVCVWADSARGTCVMNLSGWAPGPSSSGRGSGSRHFGLLGWPACLLGSYLTPIHTSLHADTHKHRYRYTHTRTHTHTSTSFPSTRHFRLIGLATATAGWGLRQGQIQRVCISVCVSVCVVAKGLAGPSGTCRLNPIPALLSWVDEQSPVLLWDPVLLPQSNAGLSSRVQQGSRGMLWATGGQLGVGMRARGGSRKMWGNTPEKN